MPLRRRCERGSVPDRPRGHRVFLRDFVLTLVCCVSYMVFIEALLLVSGLRAFWEAFLIAVGCLAGVVSPGLDGFFVGDRWWVWF